MAAQNIQSVSGIKNTQSLTADFNLAQKFNAFADSQTKFAMVYWLLTLLLIGSLFLPVTFLIVYTFNGPVILFLGLSMISFFASIIANMGGMGIKACLSTFFFSLVLHLTMILITMVSFYS